MTGAANLSCGRLCCPRAATPRPAGACGRLAVIPELHFFLKSTLARPEAQQRASPSSTAPGLQQAPDASARPLAQQAPAASTAPQAGATWRAQVRRSCLNRRACSGRLQRPVRFGRVRPSALSMREYMARARV